MMFIPQKKGRHRRYGQWAGNPMGHPEDRIRCIAEVPNPPSWVGVQCSRGRGHGPDDLFCRQHGRMANARGWKDS